MLKTAKVRPAAESNTLAVQSTLCETSSLPGVCHHRVRVADGTTVLAPKLIGSTGNHSSHSLEISSARLVAATTALMRPARTPLFSISWYPAMVVPGQTEPLNDDGLRNSMTCSIRLACMPEPHCHTQAL